MGHKTKAAAAAPVQLCQGERFLNRELSQIAFNSRVLSLAEDAAAPLLERLRFLCIVSSNLDELFEVRLASLLAQGRLSELTDVGSNTACDAPLAVALEACRRLIDRQYDLLNASILPGMAQSGFHLLRIDECSEQQVAWLRNYFETEVHPLLTPIGLDPAHPFPQVINKSLNFIVELTGRDAFGRGTGIAIMKAPRVLPRMIRIPHPSPQREGSCFCLLSSLVKSHVQEFFIGREVVSCHEFRVTRNSDLWVDEEEVTNLRQALQSELRDRQFGFAVRLEVRKDCPDHLATFLLTQFNIDAGRLFRVDGPVNMTRLLDFIGANHNPALLYQPLDPGQPAGLNSRRVFDLLERQDILLHHPFQSFAPVVDLIRNAAADPAVVAIKQTIYRAGMHSDLVEALIAAAQRGKEVTAVIELMARFDEEVNITLAERLERAGAQVVYGAVGLKTHAKLALVVRQSPAGLRSFAHLASGNYNSITARQYTDFGLLTSDPELTGEVNAVFNHLTSLTQPGELRHLWLAPFTMRKALLLAIANEAAHAAHGRPAHIIAKINALTDEQVINALYAASQAGVRIELIVRGACTLRPRVPGLSEHIRVRSIVGRFLEHSRVFYFRDGGMHRVYVGSADWMNRNLSRRIEVAFPVRDKALKRRVIREGLLNYLFDNTDAWELMSDGSYERINPRRKARRHSAQQTTIRLLCATHQPPASGG